MPRVCHLFVTCLLTTLLGLATLALPAGAVEPFDPDREADSLSHEALAERLGPAPAPARPYRLGAVMKFFGNQYWVLLADGMRRRAEELGLKLEARAALRENDPEGQAAVMRQMLEADFDILLVSPQTDTNLLEAVAEAEERGIPVVNVNDAVMPEARHWVGPNQHQNGVAAAAFLRERLPAGAEVALIRGLPGVYAVKRRSQGFLDHLGGPAGAEGLRLVADVHGDWLLQRALAETRALLAAHPALSGLYCNNDIMALGAVEAVREAGRLGSVLVVGADGIAPAKASIRRGEMAATVDSAPETTGRLTVEVALRILEGQAVPRAVYSPQRLVHGGNVGPEKGSP